MLSSLQQQIVGSLTDYQGMGVADPLTTIPDHIAPYAGELLNPDRLISVTPAVYVELDKGTITRQGTSGVFSGLHRTDLILAARGDVRGEQHHQGAALGAWLIDWATQVEIVVNGERLCAGQIAWRRYAMDREARTWTGVLTITWTAATD